MTATYAKRGWTLVSRIEVIDFDRLATHHFRGGQYDFKQGTLLSIEFRRTRERCAPKGRPARIDICRTRSGALHVSATPSVRYRIKLQRDGAAVTEVDR
jgi:hypothetical protein